MNRPVLLVALLVSGCQSFALPSATAQRPHLTFSLPETVEVVTAGHAPSLPADVPAASQPAPGEPAVPISPPVVSVGGGRGAASPAGPFVGRVLGLDPAGDRPVADARVYLSDGRQAVTDGDGAFTFEGAPPADGAYTVSHPAYWASAVAGLAADDVRLHLRPRVAVLQPGAAPALTTWTVTGRVVDTAQQAVPAALVVLRDPRGSLGLPAVSGPDGTFAMTVQGVDGVVENGSLLIQAERAGVPWLGVRQGLDLVPDRGAIGDLEVASPAHALDFTIVAQNVPGVPRITVTAVGPSGERLSVPVTGGRARVAPLPGVRYTLDVDARDNDRGRVTVLHREALAPAFGRDRTAITANLLDVPDVATPSSLTPGAPLHWAGVSGAKGYHLSALASAQQWEAFTAAPTFTLPAAFPARGAARLTITAWDQDGLTSRSVAAIGPRAMRLLPLQPQKDYRRSACVIDLP
jgi:hypothetical protein